MRALAMVDVVLCTYIYKQHRQPCTLPHGGQSTFLKQRKTCLFQIYCYLEECTSIGSLRYFDVYFKENFKAEGHY